MQNLKIKQILTIKCLNKECLYVLVKCSSLPLFSQFQNRQSIGIFLAKRYRWKDEEELVLNVKKKYFLFTYFGF
jgi:hypothetical protein